VKIRSGMYVTGLISWAASEGSTVSSLICDRWLTRKLATFMGSTDSLECRFSCHDRRSVAAAGLDLYSEPVRRGRSLALAARGLDLQRTSEYGAGGGGGAAAQAGRIACCAVHLYSLGRNTI